MTDADEAEEPWASPEIRLAYEAALGRFILAFNQLDNILTETVETVLLRLNRNDLVKSCTGRDFSFKLFVLDLLRSSTEGTGIKDAPIELMRQIAGERNVLAHGHFDQNPFDGSYSVVAKNVRASYPVERLDALTAKAAKAWERLRYSQAYFDFGD